jgi:hypothetical protein
MFGFIGREGDILMDPEQQNSGHRVSVRHRRLVNTGHPRLLLEQIQTETKPQEETECTPSTRMGRGKKLDAASADAEYERCEREHEWRHEPRMGEWEMETTASTSAGVDAWA